MIISSLEELRLFSPSNAIDNIESLSGFLSSSEHDFLEEKLGNQLYVSLITYYAASIKHDPSEYVNNISEALNSAPYATLLYLSQKAVTYDALSRAVHLQAVSVNGAGVNVASADDYKAADANIISEYKKACVKEAHSAINELLSTLERWTVEVNKIAFEEEYVDEKTEIVRLWRKSKYFYLAASMLIPSAMILQRYFNIYDSREKFIQLLPDIQYIQEDILCPIFGEDFVAYIVDWQNSNMDEDGNSHKPAREWRILHNMRKIMARHLEVRLTKISDARHEVAYNEAVKLSSRLSEYLQTIQDSMADEMAEAFALSPLFSPPQKEVTPTPSTFENNDSGNVIFVTPGIV